MRLIDYLAAAESVDATRLGALGPDQGELAPHLLRGHRQANHGIDVG